MNGSLRVTELLDCASRGSKKENTASLTKQSPETKAMEMYHYSVNLLSTVVLVILASTT